MKTLIVYHSLTGNCKKVAELLSQELSADLEPVEFQETTDLKDGKPAGPVIFGQWTGKSVKIKPAKKDPSGYDQVILGAPVWAFGLAAPMRTYLKENRERLPKKAGYFVCYGGLFGGMTLKQMAGLAGVKGAATLLIREKELKGADWQLKAKEFATRLKS
jgi:flavodoxin